MNRVQVDRRGRVQLLHRQLLPLSVEEAWQELKDLERFACKDHFHRILVLQGPLAEGTPIRILHAKAGITFWRAGRILRWVEGRRWSFSDLSLKDPSRKGFPHVFDMRIQPAGAEACQLDLRITGRWTARWLPLPCVHLWLSWNICQIGASFDWALIRRAAQSGSHAKAQRRKVQKRKGLGNARSNTDAP